MLLQIVLLVEKDLLRNKEALLPIEEKEELTATLQYPF